MHVQKFLGGSRVRVASIITNHHQNSIIINCAARDSYSVQLLSFGCLQYVYIHVYYWPGFNQSNNCSANHLSQIPVQINHQH
jgi:hypothetical protein